MCVCVFLLILDELQTCGLLDPNEYGVYANDDLWVFVVCQIYQGLLEACIRVIML